jgi:tetratricopeptide (TPR) repeat protein
MKILLGFILLAIVIPCSAQVTSASQWRTWKNSAEEDTVRLQAMSDIIKNDYIRSKPDSAFILAQLQYDLATKKGLKKYTAIALHTMGLVRTIKGDFPGALDYYSRSLQIRKDINDVQGITASMNNIATIYADQGMGAKAIEYYFQCLKIRESTGDKKGQASSLGNIGTSYSHQGKYAEALEYFKRSNAISREIKDQRGTGVSLTSIGSTYKEIGDTTQASKHYREAIAILLAIGNKEDLARAYYGMSALLESEKKHKPAIPFQEMSLEIRTELGDSIGMMKSLYGLGILYEGMHKTDQAISYAERALKIARGQNVPRVNRNIGELLSRLYEEKGDHKKALEMYRFYIAARDSMHHEEVMNVTYKEQLKYDYEKKELVSKAENEAKLNQLQLATERSNMKKNTWLIVSIGFSLLLLSGGFFLVNSFKQKNIIALQKANLLKQKLLVSQINPHFIFNSLNAIQNSVFKQDALQTGNYLSQLAGLMRLILDFTRKDYISVEAECDFITTYLELQRLRFDNKFDYKLIIDERIDKDSVFIPPMLAQPFVENAIEHGIFYKKEKGTIELRMISENGRLFYEIEDNGVGLKEAALRRKNSGHSHDSLATLITKERLYTHSQKSKKDTNTIEITDKPSERPGVKVRFEIPFRQDKPVYA